MPPRRQSARRSPREAEVRLCIVLVAPPAGVDFGLQEGKGHDYETIQKQRSHGSHLTFHCTLKAKGNRGDGLPILLGPLAQGSPTGRFIYIDVGQYAGQKDCPFSRRIKIPLGAITWEMIDRTTADESSVLEARIPGTGKDGGPSCATVQPAEGWKLVRQGSG